MWQMDLVTPVFSTSPNVCIERCSSTVAYRRRSRTPRLSLPCRAPLSDEPRTLLQYVSSGSGEGQTATVQTSLYNVQYCFCEVAAVRHVEFHSQGIRYRGCCCLRPRPTNTANGIQTPRSLFVVDIHEAERVPVLTVDVAVADDAAIEGGGGVVDRVVEQRPDGELPMRDGLGGEFIQDVFLLRGHIQVPAANHFGDVLAGDRGMSFHSLYVFNVFLLFSGQLRFFQPNDAFFFQAIGFFIAQTTTTN